MNYYFISCWKEDVVLWFNKWKYLTDIEFNLLRYYIFYTILLQKALIKSISSLEITIHYFYFNDNTFECILVISDKWVTFCPWDQVVLFIRIKNPAGRCMTIFDLNRKISSLLYCYKCNALVMKMTSNTIIVITFVINV